MTNKKRIEYDSLGQKKIDKDRLWGAQTQRSLENFKIGNETIPHEVIIALGKQKRAAALANMELGLLNKKIGNQIIDACKKIINLDLINDPNFLFKTPSSMLASAAAFFCCPKAIINSTGILSLPILKFSKDL